MINKILNTLDRGDLFCIYGKMIAFNICKIVYKIRGWSDVCNDTVTIEGLVLQSGSYIAVYHAEYALCEIPLIDNLKDALNAARNTALNVIGNQAFLENTLNEYDGEPKDLVKDLIKEELFTESKLLENVEPCPDLISKIFHEKTKTYTIQMGDEQNTLDNILQFVIDKCKKTVDAENAPFICRFNYNTKVGDERFEVVSILDSTIVFDGVLMAGILSYYGEAHILLKKGAPSMTYISSNVTDLGDLVMEELYNIVHFIQKLTSSDIKVDINIEFKEE